MQRTMHSYAIFVLLLEVIEARVYCQDSNASPWAPMGYTCPVMCETIVHAIKHLKKMDFEYILSQKTTKGIKYTNAQNTNAMNTATTKMDSANVHKDLTYRLNEEKYISRNKINNALKNGTNEHNIDEEVVKLINTHTIKQDNDICTASRKFMMFHGKIMNRKCTRKSSIDGNFLTIITNILNKYVNSDYKFNEQMMEILLEKILGKNTDLRNNIFDVNKLLKYLKHAIDAHKKHENNHVISLKSQHCMSLYLPGCYCRPGYVESSGQCVKPADCVDETSYTSYLTRIIVL